MKSAALVRGLVENPSHLAKQVVRICQFAQDHGGSVNTVINLDGLRILDLLVTLRDQHVDLVYVTEISKLAPTYMDKTLAILSIMRDLGIEIQSVHDGGEIGFDSLMKILAKLEQQYMTDKLVESGMTYENPIA